MVTSGAGGTMHSGSDPVSACACGVQMEGLLSASRRLELVGNWGEPDNFWGRLGQQDVPEQGGQDEVHTICGSGSGAYRMLLGSLVD